MIVALVSVVVFMLFYYKLSGVNATIAMFLNLIILFGALAYFGAVLIATGAPFWTLTWPAATTRSPVCTRNAASS